MSPILVADVTAAAPTETTPAPRPRTEAQRQASIANGRKSRGPIGTIAKSVSAANSLKHGMTGSGKVLPPEMAREARARRAALAAEFAPSSMHQHNLIDTAALAMTRVKVLGAALEERTDARARGAVEEWDATRAAEVATLSDLLAEDPARAYLGLVRTAAGCTHLAGRWGTVAEALAEHGRLTDDEARAALALLGVGDAHQLAGHAGARYLREMIQAVNDPTLDDDAHAEAVDELAGRIEEVTKELLDRAEDLWERVDGPDRERSPRRAGFDPSPEGQLLMRYLIAAERTYRGAIADLIRHRSRAARPGERPRRAMAPIGPVSTPAPPPAQSPPPPPAATPNSAESSARLRNEPEPAEVPGLPLPLLCDPNARFDRPAPSNRPDDPLAAVA